MRISLHLNLKSYKTSRDERGMAIKQVEMTGKSICDKQNWGFEGNI